MKRIAVVYTSLGGLIDTMKKLCKEELPGCELINIADDSLIREVMQYGQVTEGVKKRLMHYYQAAADLEPDVIVGACSSVGEVTEEADRKLRVPVLRIDHGMIQKALSEGSRIGVLASLGTTMEPTVSYIKRIAEKEKRTVTVIGRVAEGAYEANSRGEREVHDRLIAEAAAALKENVDVLVLAQGSMARMESYLQDATGLPVYSSPCLCIQEIKTKLEGLA